MGCFEINVYSQTIKIKIENWNYNYTEHNGLIGKWLIVTEEKESERKKKEKAKTTIQGKGKLDLAIMQKEDA